MKTAKSVIFTTLLMLFSTVVWADTARTYTIQVVVFSHLTPQTLNAEQWPIVSAPAIISQNNATHSANALSDEAAILKKNPGYQVLYSNSWTETWPTGSGVITLPISNGTNLQGNLTVNLGHYFDINTDLYMTEPTRILQQISNSSYFNSAPETYTFEFTQHRRMKSEELNYLGNPVMGVLIKILKQ